ncbi:transporter substrate-binding domain-containing protein [Sporolactobacillus sp. CQH2019]|uniref:transporter substrate-binding domain-containing protein n=1 Tax=Sporolactobacillus sp. CQH2019 TaxID=3023512 RepID=UPI002368AA22|nr:transporter substrate-binding domain-containing protein [Sporolactobacillus sp. CQH2019]MDD9149890.1 transporter substrate-binding domain-containing protein [Sporolactobacillus sp. CQH2019]
MKKISAAVLVFILLFTLGACSNSSSGANQSSSSSKSSSVKTVQIAVPTAEKPLSYTENGKLIGYEVEILRKIDTKLKDYSFNIQSVSSNAQQIGLDTGKYDLIAEGFFKNSVREQKYLIPNESDGASLIKIYTNDANQSITNFSDLVGKKIAPVDANGGIYNILTAYNTQNPSKKIDIPTSDTGLSTADRLKEVAAGKYDASVLPSNLGEAQIIKQLNLKIHTSAPVKVIPTYFLLSKKNEKLKEAVDSALKQLKSDGTLSALSKKYYGEDVFQYKITN